MANNYKDFQHKYGIVEGGYRLFIIGVLGAALFIYIKSYLIGFTILSVSFSLLLVTIRFHFFGKNIKFSLGYNYNQHPKLYIILTLLTILFLIIGIVLFPLFLF